MGRLFWKFFFFFWLAQVVTAVGVGGAIWLEHAEHWGDGGPPPPASFAAAHPPPPAERPPPPHRLPLPLLPILAGGLVSLLFAALLAWYFAKPISRLRKAFEAVAGGQLDTRIAAAMGRRDDELADLGADFDRMAGRLESLLMAQRRLLHDVSHELRSPLARLQAAADLLRQQPERAGEFIERIERDTRRMDHLVGELLTLARLDAGMVGRREDRVDVRELICDIAEDASFEAAGRHCTIAIEQVATSIAEGNHELLYRAFENVIRNAVKHSPEGGLVSISTEAEAGRLRVLVADQGAGVVEADLGAIFEPFVRSDRDHLPLGYGLGLAITRRVIEAHGGSVKAINRPTGGLLVVLELPAVQP